MWLPLAQLRSLSCLRSLTLAVPSDGTGAEFAAHAAEGLAAGLTKLSVSRASLQHSACFAANLSFVSRLSCLQSLELWKLRLAAPPAWLPALSALTSLHALGLSLAPGDVALLAALPSLREVAFGAWAPGGGGGGTPLAAARCLGVTCLECRCPRPDFSSLTVAFPGILDARISLQPPASADGEAAAAVPPTPEAPAVWRHMRCLKISFFGPPSADDITSLLSLLRSAAAPTEVSWSEVRGRNAPGGWAMPWSQRCWHTRR